MSPSRSALALFLLLTASSTGSYAQQEAPTRRALSPLPDRITDANLGGTFRQFIRPLAVAPKGDFETTLQYEARMRAAMPPIGAYLLPISPPSPYAEAFAECGARFAFGADDEIWRVTLPLTRVPRGRKGSDPVVDVLADCSATPRGTYEGQNIGGAKFPVHRVSVDIVGLAVAITSVSPDSVLADAELAFAMPVAEAKRAKGQLRLAVMFFPIVGTDGAPLLQLERREEPTFSAPVDIRRTYRLINATRVTFLVYNNLSGAILAKKPIDFRRH